jgi:ribosome-associated protein
MEFTKISIKEDFIRLDSAMKLADMVVTGGHAKIVIQNGEVLVNNEICTMRGKKLHKGDKVEFEGQGFEIV